MALIGLYAVILLLGAVFVVSRRETTLLRGDAFLSLTVAFLAADAVQMLLARQRAGSASFWIGAILCGLLARGRLFLFRTDANAFRTIEGCLGALLITYRKITSGYALELSGGEVRLEVLAISSFATILKFRGNRNHPKVRLLGRLFAKRFRPVFPRMTIDLR